MDLKKWNPWWDAGFPASLAGKDRKIAGNIYSEVSNGKITVITGTRRSGKTTILYQIIKKLVKSRKPTDILYLSLDDPQFQNATLDEIYSEYIAITGASKPVLFLDEVQEKEDWAKWAKSMHDRKEAEIVASGSTSYLITKEYSKYLVGRSSIFQFFPLSFFEFLDFNNYVFPEIRSSTDESKLQFYFSKYLEYGGFPEIALAEQERKPSLILSYLDDFISKDVVSAVQHGNFKTARVISSYISGSLGSKSSLNEMRKFLGVGSETIQKYINAFISSYFLIEARKFSYSIKTQEMEKKKYYFVEPAFSNVLAPSYKNRGKLLENAVAVELSRVGKEIYYYSGKNECDFIILENGKPKIAVQVSEAPGAERETKGLKEAMEETGAEEGIIVSTKKGKENGYAVVPFWEFASKVHRKQ